MIKTLKKILMYISLLVLIVLLGIIYVTIIERNLIIVKKDKIVLGKEEKIRVVQFSDTHLGDYYDINNLEKVVEKINKLNPDIVAFTGDLIDNVSQYDDLNKVADTLKKIDSKIGKYAVYGNHDIGGGAIRYYEDIMNSAGFNVLNNEGVKININEKNMSIYGGDDGLLGNHNANITVSNIDKESINLLLIHEPDLIDQYQYYPIDLALSGHSHGGQVYIPFYGPIKKNLMSEKYNRGLYTLENERQTKLYVSSGLGNTKVPFRFLNIPEIKAFDIYI